MTIQYRQNSPTQECPRGFSAADFSFVQILVMLFLLTALILIPVVTHPAPPLCDYLNHLARMHVIGIAGGDKFLAHFYQIEWRIIPNLVMDLVVPVLTRVMSIYHAGQTFIVLSFALIVTGTLALNRTLVGRWSLWPLIAVPLLYNYVFLIGAMNYIFGIGVMLWAMAAWIALRDSPLRYAVSSVFVVVLFLCHLSALGAYGLGLLSYELFHLRMGHHRPWLPRISAFVATGVPFLAAIPLLLVSPTIGLAWSIDWQLFGKIDGLIYAVEAYSGAVALALTSTVAAAVAWAWHRRLLTIHPVAWFLIGTGGVVYFAMPRVMFDTFMADQRIPVAVVFMLVASADLETDDPIVRHAFLSLLLIAVGVRLAEVSLVWSGLSKTTSEFLSSVSRIEPGSKVFVAYARPVDFGDARNFAVVHAASLAMIEKSALVSTAFTVPGKQVLRVRPDYADMVDTTDDFLPPLIPQLIGSTNGPMADMPKYWSKWPDFDYLYLLITEGDTPNPEPDRLTLVQAGSRFQLYRVHDSDKSRLPKNVTAGATRLPYSPHRSPRKLHADATTDQVLVDAVTHPPGDHRVVVDAHVAR